MPPVVPPADVRLSGNLRLAADIVDPQIALLDVLLDSHQAGRVVLAVDAYTPDCEVRWLVGTTDEGAAIVDRPFNFHHTTGALVLLLAAPHLNLLWFGARGDDSDSTIPIQRWFEAAIGLGGATLYAPQGRYHLSGTPVAPERWRGIPVKLCGDGEELTQFTVAQGSDFDVFIFDSPHGVEARDFSVVEQDANYSGGKAPVKVVGQPTAPLRLTNIRTEGFLTGINIHHTTAGQIGAVDVTLTNYRVTKARGYGMRLSGCQRITLNQSSATFCGGDGLKLEYRVQDLLIVGGNFDDNGLSDKNGDGLDCYAGAESVAIYGTSFDRNIAGIYMKTGPLTGNHSPGGYHTFTQKLYLHDVKCRGNRRTGLDINRSEGDVSNYPLVTDVTIEGGEFDYNAQNGIYLRGRNITLIAPTMRGNGAQGLTVTSAWDLEIIAPRIIGNSVDKPGKRDAVTIGRSGDGLPRSRRIAIRGGSIIGSEHETISDAETYQTNAAGEALPITHRYPIFIHSEIDEVTIDSVNFVRWHGPGGPVQIGMTRGRCTIHYGSVSLDPMHGLAGGAGSTCWYDEVAYIKRSPVADQLGWELA
jgi:hypothetical protein